MGGKKQIQEKNPDLADQDQVAHDVGVGAVVFHDLKNDRLDNFDFNLEEVVRFEGDTGPYVQYTNARAQSVLRKAAAMGEKPSDSDLALDDDWAFAVAKDLADFPRMSIAALMCSTGSSYFFLSSVTTGLAPMLQVLVADSITPLRLIFILKSPLNIYLVSQILH